MRNRIVIVAIATIFYFISSFPMFFILENVRFLFFTSYSVFFLPLVLPFTFIMPKILKSRITKTHDILISNTTIDEHVKNEYIDDTKKWLNKTFKKKKDKFINISFLFFFLFLPFFVMNRWTLIPVAILENPFIIPYFVVYWGATAILFLQSFFVIFQCMNISSMIHHFSFWEVDNTKIDKNPLGELLALNILTFLGILIFLFTEGIFFTLPLVVFLANSIKNGNYSRNASSLQKIATISTFAFFLIPFLLLMKDIFDKFMILGSTYEWEVDVIVLVLDLMGIIALMIYYYKIFNGESLNFKDMEQLSPFLTLSWTFFIIMSGLMVCIPLFCYFTEMLAGNLIIHFIYPYILVFLFLEASAVVIIMIVARKLKTITHDFVGEFLPYLKPDKVEEQKFHFWSTFNSPHSFFFAVAVMMSFFSLIHGSAILRFGTIFMVTGLAGLLWQVLNYSLLAVFGLHLGYVIWILFQSVHDFWHSISLLNEIPPDKFLPGTFDGLVLLKYSGYITLLLFGTVEIWFIGDYFVQIPFAFFIPAVAQQFTFNMTFRNIFLITAGGVCFGSIYYILKREFEKKRREKELFTLPDQSL
ncbi:MAG: hypothetical protein ACTSRW_05295 [Candidatus Helarchaeota archaeon]